MNSSDKKLLRRLNDQRIAAAKERRDLLTRVAEGETLSASEEKRMNDLGKEIDRFGGLIKSEIESHDAEEEFAEAATATESRTGVRGVGNSVRLALPTATEYRTMVAGTDSAGGYVVPQNWQNQSVSYLDFQSVVLSATAANGHKFRVETLDDNQGDELLIPKVATGPTAAMTAENSTLTPTDLGLTQLSLKPKKGYVYTLASNESLKDSRPALRQIIFDEHTRRLAKLFDDQFLTGDATGSNLRGIYNFSGINSVAKAATLADLDVFLDAINRVLTNGANPDSAVIFMHPSLWTKVMKLKTGVSGSVEYLAVGDVTAGLTRRLFGVPVYLSNAFPTNQGTGTNGTPFLVVDVDQVVIARRQSIEVSYDESRYYEQDLTAVRTLARYDIGLLNAGGVERVTDVK